MNIEYLENGVSIVRKFYDCQTLKSECWYYEGYVHRDEDLPAYTKYLKNGNIMKYCWVKNGKIYRNSDEPAYISYYPNGQVSIKFWYRDDNPQFIRLTSFSQNDIYTEVWEQREGLSICIQEYDQADYEHPEENYHGNEEFTYFPNMFYSVSY